MRAIKRLSNRFPQRRALRVINDHRRPRQRLERDPMQSDCAAKRENRGNPAGAAKHEREASYQVTNVNALLDLLTDVLWSGAVEPPKTV